MYLPPVHIRTILLATASAVGNLIVAADAQTTKLSNPPSTDSCPLLHQIDCETQSLYQSVKCGLVQVELPPPRWAQAFGEAENPVQKWNSRLNADFREKLRALQARAAADNTDAVEAYVAATQPAATQFSEIQADGTTATTQRSPLPRTLVLQRPDGGMDVIADGGPASEGEAAVGFTKILGVVLDDAGHVLIPAYVDKDAFQNHTVLIINSRGDLVPCRLMGSDFQTGLTVVQMETPSGKPLKLAGTRPVDGSLVMLLSPGGESGRLTVWTGGLQDRGMVIGIDGTIHGFVHFGQFLSADTVRPLAEELVRDHVIHRAVLGVSVSQADTPDGRRALQIEQVTQHSAAADAGLREGDYIFTLAGIPMSDVPSFSAAIAETNGRAELQILRDGKLTTIFVELRPQ